MQNIQAFEIRVQRAARYYVLGSPSSETRYVWMVCHGYGQLAAYFIRHFEPLVNSQTIIIAPEGLSRFYDQQHGRVGASWMTKEDRQAEITDYCNYISQVFNQVTAPLAHPFKTIGFGFSQGAATVSRWVFDTPHAVDGLVLWGGFFPPDLHWNPAKPSIPTPKCWEVQGTRDSIITPDAHQKARELELMYNLHPERITFDGGHQLKDDILQNLALQIHTRL